MVEAELKARVRHPGQLHRRLADLATGEEVAYRDTYYDRPDGSLEAADEELRIRTVVRPGGERHMLTFKAAAVDEASGSKPEHEVDVEQREPAEAILIGLGYVPVISFEKRCTNFRFTARGRSMLATVVQVDELGDRTWIELETLASEDDVDQALADVRAVLADLGIDPADRTTELYTDLVRVARSL